MDAYYVAVERAKRHCIDLPALTILFSFKGESRSKSDLKLPEQTVVLVWGSAVACSSKRVFMWYIHDTRAAAELLNASSSLALDPDS